MTEESKKSSTANATSEPASGSGSSTVGGKRRAEPVKKSPRASMGDASVQARNGIATAVWIIALIAAGLLVLGIVLVVLDFNTDNSVVTFITDTAKSINFLGELKTFEPGKGKDAALSAAKKDAFVNWGICAVVYLVAGKILSKLIRA